MGMVGGGRGAFIGAVHRQAVRLDLGLELVAGCFSSDPDVSRASGEDLYLDPTRVYGSFKEMARKEAALPEGERIDFVSIVTRNDTHFEVAKAFLEAGIHVVCEKPLCFNLEQARKLRDIVRKSGRIFAVTHNYAGNVMVKQARDFVRSGEIGDIRKIVVEYPQGWLATRLEDTGLIQAKWRVDPKKSGAAGAMGDLATHGEHLARYITGLEIDSLCADLTTFVKGRKLDDDGNVLVRYKGGAKGILYASQISVGEENNLTIRIYGTKGGLEWHQEHPNELVVKFLDRPKQIWRRGNGYIGEEAKRFTRFPSGHPEGYLESFGNVYAEVFRALRASAAGEKLPKNLDFPNIEDGVYGMAFIDTVVKSAKAGAEWVKFPKL